MLPKIESPLGWKLDRQAGPPHDLIPVKRRSASVDQRPLRLVKDYNFVAEGIANTSAPPDCDIEWQLHRLSARRQEFFKRNVYIVDEDVGLVT